MILLFERGPQAAAAVDYDQNSVLENCVIGPKRANLNNCSPPAAQPWTAWSVAMLCSRVVHGYIGYLGYLHLGSIADTGYLGYLCIAHTAVYVQYWHKGSIAYCAYVLRIQPPPGGGDPGRVRCQSH